MPAVVQEPGQQHNAKTSKFSRYFQRKNTVSFLQEDENLLFKQKKKEHYMFL